jgi:peptide/nickel transport system permease protein
MFDTKILKNKTMTVLKAIYNFLLRIVKGLWKFIKDVYSNKKAAFGFSIMMLFLFVVIFGNKIFPYNSATDWAQRYLPSSAEHWLGTDELGRDVFRQLIYGTKNVMMIAFFTAMITSILGVILGLISGLIGGWVDKIIQAVTNLFLIIPSFPILLLLAQLFTIEDPISFSLVLSVWVGQDFAER